MEFLEYLQMNTALSYIKNYNKYYDVYEKILNKFQIKYITAERKTGPIQSLSYPHSHIYSYGNGSTKQQLELFRGILLSAEHNYRKKEWDQSSERSQTEDDMEKGTYKGKSLEDYEQLRLETAEKIKNTNDLVKKLKYIMQYGDDINKGLEKIAEYKLIKETTAVNEKIINTAKRMTADGLSLTQTAALLGTDILSVYFTAANSGVLFNLSPEEEEQIRNAR